MARNNIERNSLDYLLTDTQPYELSEIFTYNYFYNYLIKNNKKVTDIRLDLQEKYIKNEKVFNSRWNASPLVFFISKKDGSLRKMSLIQPISALQMHFFIDMYQKDLIKAVANPTYSIRYHAKNNELFYSNDSKRLIDYKYKVSKKDKKRSIERSNSFFKIKNYFSIISFYNSKVWENAIVKYKFFAKLDYKNCFDSIYSHSFKWIISKDTTDSKDMRNSNIFPTIDCILQNINGSSSNGVVVGPEFSRMVVEVLLQHIDKDIFNKLLNESLLNKKDYEIFRFVDDFFVFANNEKAITQIIQSIDKCAAKFLLSLNRQKNKILTIPFINSSWIYEAGVIKDNILSLFQTDLKELPDDKRYLLKYSNSDISKNKNNFKRLMVLYSSERRTITSYFLSIILNKLSQKKEYEQIFSKKSSASKIVSFLDFIFYMYSHSTSFENTQKVISILYYFDMELNFCRNPYFLDDIIQKYSFIFETGNICDLVNLLLMLSRYKISLPSNIEKQIVKTIFDANDPIHMATYLLYAQYNKTYASEIASLVTKIINTNVDSIQVKKNALLYKEFWFVLIFNNCPFIHDSTQQKINFVINTFSKSIPVGPDCKTVELIRDFLKNEKNNFITWRIENVDIVKDITFRTHKRTIFRNFSKKENLFDIY